MTVIPDSITPVVGWRAWTLVGGVLSSRARWPVGKALEATCEGGNGLVYWIRPYAGSHYDLPKDKNFVNLGPRDAAANPTNTNPALMLEVPHAILWPARRNHYSHTDCPREDCSCGIYATTDRTIAEAYGPIIGRVAMWGKVIKHDHGYRSQFAYPQSLYVPDAEYEELKQSLAAYDVPIFRVSELTPSIPLLPAGPRLRRVQTIALKGIGVAAIGCIFVLFFYNALILMWWGATGESGLRQLLGFAGAVAGASIAVYYVSLIRQLWKWKGVTARTT